MKQFHKDSISDVVLQPKNSILQLQKMSLQRLLNLCEEAQPHLSELPDVREHLLFCSMKTEWDAEAQLQFELDSITAEMHLTPCSDSALVLSSMLSFGNYLSLCKRTRRLELLDTFYFKYPVLVWVLISRDGVASYYRHSNFIFYVAMRLLCDSYWALEPHITSWCDLSRACNKYLVWRESVYLPGEQVDTLDQAVGEKLFGGFAKSSADLTHIFSANQLANLLSYTDRHEELAALLPQTISHRLVQTALYCGNVKIEECHHHTPYTADAVVALAVHKHSCFSSVYATYVATPNVAVPTISDRIAAVFKRLEKRKDALQYVKETLRSCPWIFEPDTVTEALSLLCCDEVCNDIPSHFSHWDELSEGESLLFFAEKALQFSTPEMGSCRQELIWAVLGCLSPNDIDVLCKARIWQEKLHILAKATVQNDNILLQLPLLPLISCLWTQRARKFSLTVLHMRYLSTAALESPNLCEAVYGSVPCKDQFSAAFYKKLLFTGACTAEELLTDARDSLRMVVILLRDLKLDISSIDPLLFTGENYMLYFRPGL